MPQGRPTDYNDQIVSTICERIANGESLKRITDGDDMPSRVTVHAWLLKHKSFLNKYEESKAIQADVYADEMDDIAHDTTIDTQRARLIIDTRKWTSSKLKPKKYGDKLDLSSDTTVTYKYENMNDEQLAAVIKSRKDRVS